MNRYKAGAVVRSNWRGGSAATRNLLHGIRRLYRLAELEGLIAPPPMLRPRCLCQRDRKAPATPSLHTRLPISAASLPIR